MCRVVEDFSYFTLLKPATNDTQATSLFGISCTRQLAATELIDKPAEVTRSTVQKAVVVIASSPHHFGMLRERLSVVTSAWFAQRDFNETEILKRFQESLAEEAERGRLKEEEERDQYLGMSLRQLVREFRWQTLVLFKCCLLQPKMLFFGTKCERLCMMQFSLVSLIPGLIRKLQDAADPELDSYERGLSKPTSLKTSDRTSLLSYMGLPLQIFSKGSLFGPYTPLQQLDILADFGTKSYIVGSTNSLLLQQKDRYSDILINLDESTISITSPSLRSALQLSTADRRWIDFITESVVSTWDDADPERPSTMGYVGSEDFIRLQFEEYLLSLISSVKCSSYLATNPPSIQMPAVDGDPSLEYNIEWVDAWKKTHNYAIWQRVTDELLFDIVEPKHPCAGGLTIDDVQRRLAQQVKDLGLDERFAVGKEVVGRNLAAGREKASAVFNKLYADMELLRENQRKRAEEQKREAEKNGTAVSPTTSAGFKAPDLSKAQAAAATAGSRVSAYAGSWASWAAEKKKGWGAARNSNIGTSSKRNSEETEVPADFIPRDITPKVSMQLPRRTTSEIGRPEIISPRSTSSVWSGDRSRDPRPPTQESYKESLFDAEEDSMVSAQPTDDGWEVVDPERGVMKRKRMSLAAQSIASASASRSVSPAPSPKLVEERKTDSDGFTSVDLNATAVLPVRAAPPAAAPTPASLKEEPVAQAPKPIKKENIPTPAIISTIPEVSAAPITPLPALPASTSASPELKRESIDPSITTFSPPVPASVPAVIETLAESEVAAISSTATSPTPATSASVSSPSAPGENGSPLARTKSPIAEKIAAARAAAAANAAQAGEKTPSPTASKHGKSPSSSVSAMRARFEAAQANLGK